MELHSLQEYFESFRLLTEYHSFLFNQSLKNWTFKNFSIKFPSPYGVSFILIRLIIFLKCLVLQFPSPYGVSFILIKLQGRIISVADKGVSVSLRSIIHSYLQKS